MVLMSDLVTATLFPEPLLYLMGTEDDDRCAPQTAPTTPKEMCLLALVCASSIPQRLAIATLLTKLLACLLGTEDGRQVRVQWARQQPQLQLHKTTCPTCAVKNFMPFNTL